MVERSEGRQPALAACRQDLIWRKPHRTRADDAWRMNQPHLFHQFLQAAASQPEPQRLLFVFATAALPDDATPAQTERFLAGGGGTLTPWMTVDKGVDDLVDFAALLAESREAGQSTDSTWQVVFAAGLSGRNGQAPSSDQVEAATQAMVEGVRVGRIENYLALDTSGEALQFV